MSHPAELERNKAIALRFKKAQGTPEQEAVMREVLAPRYQRVRGGMYHLEQNAHGADFPPPGKFLRTAFPDRADVIEDVVAEGDCVGLLFRLTATHAANFLGVPATGRKVEAYECALLRVVGGRMVEGWFMADEAGLLSELGAPFPRRPDGKLPQPRPSGAGEEPDVVLQRLRTAPVMSVEDQNRLSIVEHAASRRTFTPDDCPVRRSAFQHLEAHGAAYGTGARGFAHAFPDWRERINVLIAEGDRVWMRSTLSGTHAGFFYGLPPTGRQVEIPQLTIARFAEGAWRDTWRMADELGLMLQLDALHVLEGRG